MSTGYRNGHRNPDRECPRCGDPLPLDGQCDCRGDSDRDYTANGGGGGLRMLHTTVVRLGRLGGETGHGERDGDTDGDSSVVEMWL